MLTLISHLRYYFDRYPTATPIIVGYVVGIHIGLSIAIYF